MYDDVVRFDRPRTNRQVTRRTGTGVQEIEYDDQQYPRLPSSSRRYYAPTTTTPPKVIVHQPIPARRSAQPEPVEEEEDYPVRTRRPRRRFNFLVYIGIAMFVMVFGFMSLSWLGTWWTNTTNDWKYGTPRTYQVNVVVGHGDSIDHPTHFIAENLNAQIVIIEIPGGNTAKAKIYNGPPIAGDTPDLIPVTLIFRDTTGNGKLDMIIAVGDTRFIYLNQNGQFVPKPNQ